MLNLSWGDIGVAGLKDRVAITQQYVSIPARCLDDLGKLETESIRILRSALHGNKLRTGHLKGNRFSILVRDVADGCAEQVEQIADQITRFGFPSYYGKQRFGHDGETLDLGFDLLRGNKKPYDIPRSRRRFLLRFALSAMQSFLFNHALSQRLADGLLQTVLPGDVMQVRETGGIFVVEDVECEQLRSDAREIAITGPMFGIKMRKPSDDVLKRELNVLSSQQLTLDQFRPFKKLMPGTRRQYAVYADEFRFESEPEGIRFHFTLPSGAYATTLLREFMKTESESPSQTD